MYLLKSARQKNIDNNARSPMLLELSADCRKQTNSLQTRPSVWPTTMLCQTTMLLAMPLEAHPLQVRPQHNNNAKRKLHDVAYVP
jgi:hypothetical protein